MKSASGYYGACNEELMKISLVKSGPLSVSFEVYPDFMHYSGGVYYHTQLLDKFNPFEVLIRLVIPFFLSVFLSRVERLAETILNYLSRSVDQSRRSAGWLRHGC